MKKQIVPNAPEIESAVLGALMSEPNMIDEVSGLHDGLFFTPAHALIFATIRDIRANGGVPNIIATTQVLSAADRLEFAGGAGALTEMVGKSAGGPAAVEYHAQTLRDLHARREILSASQRMLSAASDMSQPADAVLQSAGESVLSLSLGQSTDSMRPVSAIVPQMLEELEKLMTPGQKLGVETGFRALDYMTGGLRGGQLTIVAGRPAMGKSALMLNIAENMAKRGVPVLYFSLEMPANELSTRVVLSRAETNIEVIRNGFLDHASKLRIMDASTEFASEPLYVDDRGGLTMLDIRGRARLAVRRWGVKCIFVDYLQLVSHTGAQSRENEVGFVSRGLKAMAMELNIPVVSAAQVNRKAEERSDNRPKMSDLRESGSIEQDADLVCLLHRPAYYAADQETEPEVQDAELMLAKHRAGATGKVNLVWRPRLTRFENAALGNRLTDGEVFAPSPKLWEAINESRAKGARGERMWRDELRAAFGDSGIRRGQQFSGLGDSPDVVCPCLPDIHWEVKFCQVVKIRDWMAQAIRDAKAKLFPVVAHKRNGEDWLVTLRAQDFLTILRRSDFLVPTQQPTKTNQSEK